VAKKRKIAVRDDVENLSQPHPNHNADITKILAQMGMIEKSRGQKHKHAAYMAAVSSLAAHHERIGSGQEARELHGIGLKIGKKIQEILDTGKLAKLDKLLSDPNIVALTLLCRVSGVGPQAAMKWVKEGITTIEALKTQKLNHHQQMGVKYFEDFEKRIPREEMEKHVAVIKAVAKDIDPDIKLKCCGSFRRGLPSSGDIDILVTHPSYVKQNKKDKLNILKQMVTNLKKVPYLVDDLSQGVHQYMGVAKLEDTKEEKYGPRRIDIKIFPIETFFPALLHFTGSGEHNRQLSCIAINRGFKLSEYSICPVGITGVVGDPLPITSERDIFEVLRVPYRTPPKRSV